MHGCNVLTIFFSALKVSVISVELDKNERMLYEITQSWLLRKFDDEAGQVLKYTHIFVCMLRLRQICLHWSLVLEGRTKL